MHIKTNLFLQLKFHEFHSSGIKRNSKISFCFLFDIRKT